MRWSARGAAPAACDHHAAAKQAGAAAAEGRACGCPAIVCTYTVHSNWCKLSAEEGRLRCKSCGSGAAVQCCSAVASEVGQQEPRQQEYGGTGPHMPSTQHFGKLLSSVHIIMARWSSATGGAVEAHQTRCRAATKRWRRQRMQQECRRQPVSFSTSLQTARSVVAALRQAARQQQHAFEFAARGS